jgi:glutamate carboxypeptidase
MRLKDQDRAVLEAIAADGGRIIDRAVAWCAINSGSRHLAGLERQRQVLLDAVRRCRPRRPTIPLALVRGRRRRPRSASSITSAIAVVVRPEAPVQVVLTGHYDTVYPETSAFQTVQTRPDGALHGRASPT